MDNYQICLPQRTLPKVLQAPGEGRASFSKSASAKLEQCDSVALELAVLPKRIIVQTGVWPESNKSL